jgi:hypothetical protein
MTATAELIADIDAAIDEARGEITEADMVNLVAARNAIKADPAIRFLDVLNILNPPAAPKMTAAQKDRLGRARDEAAAAGSTITHRVTDNGQLLITEDYDGHKATAAVDRAGNLSI